jgi:C4-dicarboxylate transporter DctQ subunit
VSTHLGVDAFVRLFADERRRWFGLAAVAAGLIYATILFLGSWQYVGKLYKIGIEAEDLPIPQWVPMVILPIGVALLFFRLAQVGWRVWTRQQSGLLLGDEAADAIRHHLEAMSDDGPAAADATGRRPEQAP